MAEASRRKEREGVVVSNKMQKTAVVLVNRTIAHPRYQKVFSQHKKYYAHNEMGEIKEGQRVRIRETRPLSRLKRWEIIEVLSN